jgi:hypothetical protein
LSWFRHAQFTPLTAHEIQVTTLSPLLVHGCRASSSPSSEIHLIIHLTTAQEVLAARQLEKLASGKDGLSSAIKGLS